MYPVGFTGCIWAGPLGQGQTKLGSLAVVKTLGLNPTLNKQLKTSVSSVSPKVVAVRKSFEAVGGIVERFSKHEADQKLLEHWKSIESVSSPAVPDLS